MLRRGRDAAGVDGRGEMSKSGYVTKKGKRVVTPGRLKGDGKQPPKNHKLKRRKKRRAQRNARKEQR